MTPLAEKSAKSTGSILDLPIAELLYPDLPRELGSTRRVLERFPEGQGVWRPHDKSRTLAELATHVAGIPGRGASILETEERDIAGRTPPAPAGTAAELLAMFDEGAAALREALPRATPESLAGEWTLRAGSHILQRGPRRIMLRVVTISHLVHHRAQLGVYYRLLGVPVPGVYGPSADEPIGGARR